VLKVKNVEVFGWDAAIRGMRNPMNSWDRSDSGVDFLGDFEIGPNDMGLMLKLIRGGSPHRKFLRMIHVTMDITAPLYWWKEFDTYKIGTVANSCSTMHKIHAKEFEDADFSCEHLDEAGKRVFEVIIDYLNASRQAFLSSGKNDKKFWWNMIQLLPSSYNQTRTIDLNYETVLNIIIWRTGHKLDEWHTLIDEFYKLPYIANFTGKVVE
jgi:hypothetical protein